MPATPKGPTNLIRGLIRRSVSPRRLLGATRRPNVPGRVADGSYGLIVDSSDENGPLPEGDD